MIDYATQASYDVRFEWGLTGLRAVASDAPVVVVVDVLSFSTCVSVALSQGATVLPFEWKDDRAATHAQRHGAQLASARTRSSYSLSPSSLRGLSAQSRLVLPSPNGSSICFGAQSSRILTGCFRNRRSAAKLAASFGRPIAVIAAGERWPDGSLRPATEDLLGAGAIISKLGGTRSPEAVVAAAAFEAQESLSDALLHCASGRELVTRGFADEVAMASELDLDEVSSLLDAEAFSAAESEVAHLPR